MTFIDLTSYENGSHTLTFRAPNGTVHNGTYYTHEIEEIKIIGHPIELNHWLRVLGKTWRIVGQGDEHYKDKIVPDGYLLAWHESGKQVFFNLTTGQPATEADYQDIAKILNIE